MYTQAEHPLQVLSTQVAADTSPAGADLADALQRFLQGRGQPSVFAAVPEGASLASLIDHTALRADTTEEQVRLLCDEAWQYRFASVCVNTCYVRQASGLLDGSGVGVCGVVGFPLGAMSAAAKAYEAALAVRDGATEIDMVMNVGLLKSRRYERVEEDVRAVVESARETAGAIGTVVVKAILETALLTDEEKVIACVLAANGGADFVKTSTGFSTGGATVADITLMRRTVGDRMGVKASGGIRTQEQARAMIAAGATRIGASASVAIVEAATSNATGY